MDDSLVFLSTLPAKAHERRMALGLAIISVIVFLALAPFAKLSLPKIPPFIPIYEAALVINDLITAVLLFGQFSICDPGRCWCWPAPTCIPQC